MKRFQTYSPGMDALTKAEEKLLAEDLPLIEKAVQVSAKVNKTKHATRNAHAKSFGFVRGHFIPVKNDAVDIAQLLGGANLGIIMRYSHPNFFVTKGVWEYPIYGCLYHGFSLVAIQFILEVENGRSFRHVIFFDLMFVAFSQTYRIFCGGPVASVRPVEVREYFRTG